ncbi:MAG TPA: DUF438 domain-containing protein [Bacteroidetes bacterium]|nr:DUF438 domain-containing protein [Bacteroidota bacterium]HEX05649.1 DUF438 domain-containing protein [Bacteroidota bacterium]
MNDPSASPYTLTPDIRLHDLVQERPYLIEKLAEISPNFKALKNPVMRNTVGRVATLRRAASMGNMSVNELLNAIADAIRNEEGIEVVVETGAALSAEDQQREDLKALILSLHAGTETLETAKVKFEAKFGTVPAKDIAIMEQQLISEGMPVEMIQELCDVHVGIMGDGAAGPEVVEQTPGHPVFTFVAENLAIMQMTAKTRSVFEEIDPSSPDLKSLAEHIKQVRTIEKHYLRKENLLFPKLEREGFEGPSKVMWAIHDEIRAELKEVEAFINDGDMRDMDKRLSAVLGKIDDMVTKEESILLPTSIDLLKHEDWADIYKQEEEIGFTLIERSDEWSPRIKMVTPQDKPAADHFMEHHPEHAVPVDSAAALARDARDDSDSVVVTHGQLTQKQLDRILLTIPVELSFVDENDEVRYFTGSEHKIFPRSPAVIGRKVQNCHPPKSLNVVNRILDEMKAGTRETSEFWMDNFAGRFIHIRYDAVRDEDGTYLGCLEATQDITHLRTLNGSKRLLD